MMKSGCFAAFTLFLWLSIPSTLWAAEPFPFPVSWDSSPDSFLKIPQFLDPPAGRDGFITIKDGHFIKGNGERLRLWGINLSMNACFPPKEDAPAMADYIARMGFNSIRFHFMDTPATGFLEGDPKTSRKISPEIMDQLDFLFAELKKRGIYSNFNLNVARQFKEGDGVKDSEYLGFAKAATYFDERIIELQKEFAKDLLTHTNPYTRTKYIDDPALVIVEILNENSLVESWFSGHLLGKNTQKYPGTWTDIPASYEKQLTEKYNAWLKANFSDEEIRMLKKECNLTGNVPVPRLRPDEFANASRFRFHTEATFYMETEKTFFQDMHAFLKNQVGVKASIIGTSDHNHGKSGYPHITSTSMLDVVDGHVYWQHPAYGEKNGDFTIPNTPMVNDPFNSTVTELSRTPLNGKPYTVSETNHPYPNEYACEGIPILMAYAALQDWDGIFFYNLSHKTPGRWINRQLGHFDFNSDPVKMIESAVCGLAFCRADIQPASKTILRSYTKDEVVDSLLLPSSERPLFTPGFSSAIPLIHSTRIESLNSNPTIYEIKGDLGKRIVSDTKELVWSVENPGKGFVKINTPKTQALIGYIKNNPETTENISMTIENEFASVICVSLENLPISQSKRLLVSAAAKALNTGTVWNEKHTTLVNWGTGPVLVDSVSGTIHLKGVNATGIRIAPLDGEGNIMGEPVKASADQGIWQIPLGQAQTLWYCIDIQ